MKNIISIVFKSMKKKWYISAVIIIVMSILYASILSVYSAADSVNNTYKEKMQDTYGEQTGTIFNLKNDLIKNKIQQVGTFEVWGKAILQEFIIDKEIIIGTADESAIELHHINLIQGRFPSQGNEIVVEKWVINKLGLEEKVGQTITFKTKCINERGKFKEEKSKKYTITGIINNYSFVQIDAFKENETYRQLPNILSYQKETENSLTHYSIKVEDKTQFEEVVSEHCSECVTSINKSYNDAIRRKFINIYNVKTIELFKYIVFISCIILNLFIFYLYSFSKKTFLYQSYLLGAKKIQLFFYLFVSFIVYLLFSLVGGIALSSVFHRIFEWILNLVLDSNLSIKPEWNDVIKYTTFYFLLINILVIILTKFMIRSTISDCKNKKFVKGKIKFSNPIMLIVYRSALIHKRKFLCLSISLMFCVVAFSCSPLLKLAINSYAKECYSDFAIKELCSDSYGEMRMVNQDNFGIKQSDISVVLRDSAIKEYYTNQMLDFKIMNQGDIDSFFLKLYRNSKIIPEEEGYQQALEEEKRQYNYAVDTDFYNISIVGVNEPAIDILSQYVVEGELDMEALSTAKEVVFCLSQTEYDSFKETNLKNVIGETLTLTQIIDYNESLKKGKRIDFTVKIAALVVVPDSDSFCVDSFCKGELLWLCESYEKLGINVNYTGVFINLKDKSDSGDIPLFMSQFESEDSSTYYLSLSEIEENKKETSNVVNVIIFGIVGVIGNIVVAFILIQYFINITAKEQLLRSLYCIGMKEKEMNNLLFGEFLSYTIVAYLVALPTIAIISYTLILEAMKCFKVIYMRYVIKGYLLSFILMLVIGIILKLYNKQWLKKHLQ